MTKELFDDIQDTIPTLAGVYQYFNADEQIIYVGKAKNLKKRVSSYFQKIHNSYKTRKLVAEIHRIQYTVVNSEQDALLLENSLIKQYQPKYNIVLKDDRSYPYIVIKNEPFPRVFITRKYIKDGSVYLGPYTHVAEVYNLLNLIKQTVPLRTCKLALTDKNIQAQKFKPCLEYHIGNCKAPCAALQDKTSYQTAIDYVKDILKGKLGNIIRDYKHEMLQLSEEMAFEKAAVIKKKIEYLQQYQSKSIIVNTQLDDIDICGMVTEDNHVALHYMVLVQGAIIHSHQFVYTKKLDEQDAEILQALIPQFRDRFHSTSKEIIVPYLFEHEETFLLTIPKGGDKKKLLLLAMQNAQHILQDHFRKKALLLNSEPDSKIKILEELQAFLHLPDLPTHIECFDNSNFQGSYPVAAMVCFKDGVPFKKEYRHFHIKSVQGINDFASMKEIVYRRYRRVLDEKLPLPKLIVIDGGKGQLSAAMESIHALDLQGKVTVIGLAKNVEEIFFPGDKESIKLPFQSNALNLLKNVRDEVHRFGITFHRQTRSKGIIKNELTEIAGIGEKTAELLLKQFRSVAKVKSASPEALEAIVGKEKTMRILAYFHSEKETDIST